MIAAKGFKNRLQYRGKKQEKHLQQSWLIGSKSENWVSERLRSKDEVHPSENV